MTLMRRWGKAVWVAWFLILVIGGFILFESLAFTDQEGLTLSRLVYDAWHAWPLFGPLLGIAIGILLSHFFWEWSPKLEASEKRNKHLETELGRAYRAVRGFYSFARRGQPPDKTAIAYHSLTIGAAIRFVDEGSLDGSSYFEGKSVDLLRQTMDKEP